MLSISPNPQKQLDISTLKMPVSDGSSASIIMTSRRKRKKKGQRTFRSITIEGEELEFSDGFTELHTATYRI